MLETRVALIPTLKLWSWELRRAGVPAAQIAAFQHAGVEQLREYFTAGGESCSARTLAICATTIPTRSSR